MADFSLTTLFVTTTSQTTLPNNTNPEELTAGQLGIFIPVTSGSTGGSLSSNVAATIAGKPYFQIAQGRTNTYLQGTKKSDKISGVGNTGSKGSNVTEWYKVIGCPTAANQITDVTNFSAQCGDVITLTLRADSSYLRTLYFNGFTRSVTIQAPCCDCGDDPCTDIDPNELINQLIAKLTAQAPGINPDNISLNKFYTLKILVELLYVLQENL